MDNIIVRKPCEAEIEFMSRQKTWESDVCEFDYEYEFDETALIIKGRGQICVNGECIEFGAGDLLVTPKYLKCRWKVLEPIKKYER